MRSYTKSLTERRSDAAAAKQAMLRKAQSAPGPDDPAVMARRAERKAIAEAREARIAAKAAAAEQARIEAIARAEAEAAERKLAEELAELERIEQEAALEEQKKRARDERYAARKAAKRG
ncbi:MAG: DUF6481 family protein [Hyphomicrobiaceae bacterium]|nr:DUF6481 family protein [Hyphomicrobiaceae bacterium]